MVRNVGIVLFIGLSACVSQPAPGTKPSDMTAVAHWQACRDHQRLAQAQEKRANELDGGKGAYTAQVTGERERDIASQHGRAAKAVDPGSPDCP